ncbi:hypothetical protein [Intrasporangium oryzae]|uniref:hypothetical protein n=1 Tax=Intrasporangium oryzae TaxID=412687 RepID=UPI0012F9A799|nr:hypothetical protein [Intrasporangium oryzae]
MDNCQQMPPAASSMRRPEPSTSTIPNGGGLLIVGRAVDGPLNPPITNGQKETHADHP